MFTYSDGRASVPRGTLHGYEKARFCFSFRTLSIDGGSRPERASNPAECDVCLIAAIPCNLPPFPAGDPRRLALGLARDGNGEWKPKAPAVSGAAQFGAVPSPLRNMGGLFSVLQKDRSIVITMSSVILSGDSPW